MSHVASQSLLHQVICSRNTGHGHYSRGIASQSLLHQVICSRKWRYTAMQGAGQTSQSLLHQVICSRDRLMGGFKLSSLKSQSLLHQVICSRKPDKRGYVIGNNESQSLLHQVICSRILKAIKSAGKKGIVAIPSSSGHLFPLSRASMLQEALLRCRNPFFIRSFVPAS